MYCPINLILMDIKDQINSKIILMTKDNMINLILINLDQSKLILNEFDRDRIQFRSRIPMQRMIGPSNYTGCSLDIVFSLKCCDFSEICQFCCKRWGLTCHCVHSLTPRGNRERSESSKKIQYLLTTLYLMYFVGWLVRSACHVFLKGRGRVKLQASYSSTFLISILISNAP